ncbi:MAG: MMPL family transporter, partial [Nocardioides sp.]|nr:MMPL family transporter [Nocardioides sp.]
MAVHNPLAGVARGAARWSATHPWQAIGAWVAFVAFAVGLAVAVPTVEAEGSDYWEWESGEASAMIDEARLDDADSEVVLIAGDDMSQAPAAAAAITDGMQGLKGVAGTSDPLWNDDRSAMLLSIQLARDQDDVELLQAVTEQVAVEHPDLSIEQAGERSVDAAIDERVGDDLSSAEATSVPVTLILMLIAFGALIAAGVPVLLAVGGVAATIGISAPLSHLVHAETTVISMIVLIGMAVGVDYSLFYLKREREERARGRSTLDAVEIAAETSGHSIIVSGFAVIASMTGLFVAGGATQNSLAVCSILVVAIAVLGSLTVLPAVLVKLGRWVDRPRVPGLWRLNNRIGKGGISRRILAPVVRRPVAALILTGLVVGALTLPALGMKLHTGSLETLPASIDEVQTMQTLSDEFPGEGPVVDVVGSGDPDEVRRGLSALRQDALERDDFAAVGGQDLKVSDDGRTAVLTLGVPFEEASEKVDHAVEELRDDLIPAHLDGRSIDHAVGGDAARAYDAGTHMNHRLPLVIGFILALTMVMMGFAFRSGPIAVVSAALNLLSVGVAFGLMTLVFQHGWGDQLLDFTTPGFLID